MQRMRMNRSHIFALVYVDEFSNDLSAWYYFFNLFCLWKCFDPERASCWKMYRIATNPGKSHDTIFYSTFFIARDYYLITVIYSLMDIRNCNFKLFLSKPILKIIKDSENVLSLLKEQLWNLMFSKPLSFKSVLINMLKI